MHGTHLNLFLSLLSYIDLKINKKVFYPHFIKLEYEQVSSSYIYTCTLEWDDNIVFDVYIYIPANIVVFYRKIKSNIFFL